MTHREKNKLGISIVMTALNEDKNIEAAVTNVLRAYDDFNINGELIVINDGSTDKTRDIVCDIMKRDGRVRIIDHATPQGIGASFWDGIDAAREEVVCWFPGDNENDPWEILCYFDLMEHVDIVIPFVYDTTVRTPLRNALSFIYHFIINTTFATSLNYTNGTILYRRGLLKELNHRNPSFFFQTDILIRLVKRGYLFAEVPYRLGVRSGGKSKAVSFSSLTKVTRGYLGLVKDIYFTKNEKNEGHFLSNTVTAQRYNKQ